MFTVVSYFSYSVYQAFQSMRDAYLVWHAAAMVIDHMRTHHNRWPSSWDELRQANPDPSESGGFQNFEEVRKRITIDWAAQPGSLVKADYQDEEAPPFRVIYLRNGKIRYWTGYEPNHVIWHYLQQNKHRFPLGSPNK
jgi:hypothetical protein